MKHILIGLLIISILLMTGCTSDSITITRDDASTNVDVSGESVALTTLIAGIESPEEYVYTIIGDRESTITYEEFVLGTLHTEDNSLSFATIMCECADITGIREIIIEDKVVITKENDEWVALTEPKTYIEEYITDTPEAYEYTINGQPVAYDNLTKAPVITMIVPAGTIEIKLAGEQPVSAYQATLGDAIEEFTTTPEVYTYYVDGEAIDLAANENLVDEKVELKRNTLTIKHGEQESIMRLSTTSDTNFADFIIVEGKEALEYKIMSSEGFSPSALSWEQFSSGVWDVEEQVSSFSAVNSKKYAIRDVAVIEILTPTVIPEADTITIADALGTANKTTYEGEPAVRLTEFLKDLEQPGNYLYRLTAADGYSPEPFTYDDMQEGYWLLETQETMFPSKNTGKNRIRDLESITPLPRE